MLTYTRFQRKINICILNKHNFIKMVCNLITISPGHEGGDELGEKYINILGVGVRPPLMATLSYPFILLQNIQNILLVLRLKR